MTSRIGKLVVLGVFAALGGAAWAAIFGGARAMAWSPGGSEPEMRVAYVNLSDVFQRYNGTTRAERRLEKENRRAAAEIRRLEDRKKDLEDEARGLRWDDPRYREKLEQAKRAGIQAEVLRRTAKNAYIDEAKKSYNKIYEDILGVIDDLREERKYTLVLKIDSRESLTQQLRDIRPDELLAEIRFRSVLAYNPADDISEDVLARLNQQ